MKLFARELTSATMKRLCKRRKTEQGMISHWTDLHNQFHAFDNTLCCVEEAKTGDTDLRSRRDP